MRFYSNYDANLGNIQETWFHKPQKGVKETRRCFDLDTLYRLPSSHDAPKESAIYFFGLNRDMFEYRVEVRVHWMIVKLFRLNFWNIVACMVNMLMIMFYLQLKVWRDRCPTVTQIPANFPLYVEILTQRLMIVKLVVTNTLCGLV